MEIQFVLIYLCFVSFISVIVCVFDTLQAKRSATRISEKTLLFLCVLGGSVAMYITMRIIRHKTLHTKFMVGIPIIILLQCAVFGYFCIKS